MATEPPLFYYWTIFIQMQVTVSWAVMAIAGLSGASPTTFTTRGGSSSCAHLPETNKGLFWEVKGPSLIPPHESLQPFILQSSPSTPSPDLCCWNRAVNPLSMGKNKWFPTAREKGGNKIDEQRRNERASGSLENPAVGCGRPGVEGGRWARSEGHSWTAGTPNAPCCSFGGLIITLDFKESYLSTHHGSRFPQSCSFPLVWPEGPYKETYPISILLPSLAPWQVCTCWQIGLTYCK